jgi:protoporphyrinogen oxidase
MRIAIIGAGPTGLTAALKLSLKNHQVVVFEKEKFAGGLMAGFKKKGWDWSLEYFYHHIFPSDKEAIKLIHQLGLKEHLYFQKPKTSIFKKGRIDRFDSAISLVKFPHLPFIDKIRAGIMTLSFKINNNWLEMEKFEATEGIKKIYGLKTYQVLWRPLLKSKFGSNYKNISLAWFWSRLKKRSNQLGYLKGGFQILIDKMVEEIKKNKGQILFNHEIKNFEEIKKLGQFDRVIFTTPSSIFLKIMGNKLPQEYQQKIKKMKMIGTVDLILSLKESFLTDGTYWLNVNEEKFPFVAVVEQTNFIEEKYYNNQKILYVGGYYAQNHRYFKMSKEAILKEWFPYLQKINKKFKESLITDIKLSANAFAQPIVPTDYSKDILAHQTPVKNVYLTNMQQIYPWDRGLNYAIEEGQKIVDEILEE